MLRTTFGDRVTTTDALTEWAWKVRNAVDHSIGIRDKLETDTTHPILFPHQIIDVDFLTTMRKAILANSPGAGKTLSVISSLKSLDESGEDVFPALIVAPSSVKQSWMREFNRWWPDVDVEVVGGTSLQRRKQIMSGAQVLIMNYEALRSHSRLVGYGSIALRRCPDCGGEDASVTSAKCHAHNKELNAIQFKSVVADEAHRIKDPRSQQSRSLMATAEGAHTRFALSGTPIANSLIDLWALLHFIDPVEWPSRTKWMDRQLQVMQNMWGSIIACDVKPEMQNEFDLTILPRMRRVPLDAVVHNLPDVIVERRDAPMSTKQERAYATMLDTMMSVMGGEDILMAESPMTMALRLLQLASSYGSVEHVANNDGTLSAHLTLTDPSSKLDAFMDLLPDLEGRTIAVFAVSRQLLMMLSERLTKHKIDHGMIVGNQKEWQRQEAIDDFQKGKTKIILVGYSAGGTGITLTSADTMVTLQRPWSQVEWTQAQARVRRIGSEIHDTILRIDLVAPQTMEEAVFDALELKGRTLEQLVKDKEMMIRAARGRGTSLD
jgi:SNF2 family DNA or RNA helicase